MTEYKYKNVIKNGLKHTQKIYDEMTDWNEHGEAIRLICEYFEADKLVNIMEHINTLHDLYGHLPKALGDLRNEVWEEISPKYYKHFKGIDIKKYQNEPF